MSAKNQILEESYKLFHQFGIKSITMDDIAKHLSISKKTLYKHFKSKKDIVYEVMKKQIDYTETFSLKVFSESDNAIHELFRVMEMIRKIFHGMNASLLFDLQKYHPKSWRLMEDHQRNFVQDLIGKTLQRGMEEGLFRKDLNVNILIKLRLEEMKSAFDPIIFPSTEYNMEEVQIVLMEHFILGITTLEGHEMVLEYQKKMKNA